MCVQLIPSFLYNRAKQTLMHFLFVYLVSSLLVSILKQDFQNVYTFDFLLNIFMVLAILND